MNKKMNGFFTFEASVIVPLVLFWYLLILLFTLFLYSQGSASQDSYLLCMRTSRFTYGGDNFGEVIYGEEQKESWSNRAYVIDRMQRKRNLYPGMKMQEQICEITQSEVTMYFKGTGMRKGVEKTCQRINPITVIRQERKEHYD